MTNPSGNRDGDPFDQAEQLCSLAAIHLAECSTAFKTELPVAEQYLDEEILSLVDPPVLAESVGGDPRRALRERVVQAIAVGFVNRASGSGLERLRNAVALAQLAAAGELTESDWVPDD